MGSYANLRTDRSFAIPATAARNKAAARVALPKAGYEVHIAPGLLEKAGKLIAPLVPPRLCCIITDESVAALHAPTLQKSLTAAGFTPAIQTVPAGEASKSLAHVERIAESLAELRMDRASPVIALGGGMVGDLAGFVAATWLRGVPFFHCSTTTEGAIDAAIGGKTAVNLKAGKNLVGAFHQPKLVLIDTATFRSLPERDLRAGLAEAVKHALIRDPDLLDWLDANVHRVLKHEDAATVELIRRNVQIKAAIVQEDERETGGHDSIGRAALNFGHTIAHAIEAHAAFALRHGECVAIGLLAALQIGVARKFTDPGLLQRTRAVLKTLGLPTHAPADLEPTDFWTYMTRDKKSAEGRVRFLLMPTVGKLAWADDVTAAEAADALSALAPAGN